VARTGPIEASWKARLDPALLVLACAPAVVSTIGLLRVFAGRLTYGIDAELMEGGALLHAYRLMHGLPVYTTPGSGFMPYPYPPLHTLVLAALGKVFGLGFGLGRAVSVASTLLTGALLSREVYRETRTLGRPLWWAVLSTGFIAAGFPLTGGAYDLVRVDSLALSLSVASAVVVFSADERFSKARLGAATLLTVAAVFTKQTNVFFAGWLVLFLASRDPKHGLALAASCAGCSILVLGLLQWVTRGNYWYYTVTQLGRHRVVGANFLTGASTLVKFAPYLPALPVLAIVLRAKNALSRRSLLWCGVLVSSLPVTLLPYAKMGGSVNNFMSTAVLAGPSGLCLLADAISGLGSRRVLARVTRAGGALACTAYLLLRSFDPAPYVAGHERRAAVRRFDAFVSELGGGVLIPGRPFNAISSGERTEQVNAVSWFDLLLTGASRPSFLPFLEQTNPRWVILTGEEPANMVRPLSDRYFLRGFTPEDTWKAEVLPWGSFHPPYVLERDAPDPPATRCLFDFESGSLDGWHADGEAFGISPRRVHSSSGEQPLLGVQGVIVGAEGNFLLSSAASDSRDRAVGTVDSPEFVIDGPSLHLRVGGSATKVSVQLLVGHGVRRAVAGPGVDYLQEVVWNVDRDFGKTARLRVIDDDPGGHVLLDRVRIADSAAPVAR